jgi:hypothetical protein
VKFRRLGLPASLDAVAATTDGGRLIFSQPLGRAELGDFGVRRPPMQVNILGIKASVKSQDIPTACLMSQVLLVLVFNLGNSGIIRLAQRRVASAIQFSASVNL